MVFEGLGFGVVGGVGCQDIGFYASGSIEEEAFRNFGQHIRTLWRWRYRFPICGLGLPKSPAIHGKTSTLTLDTYKSYLAIQGMS